VKATRETYGETLKILGRDYPSLVVLDADLAKSTKSEKFGEAYPERFFECGIAEGNMVGVAAGLGLAGFRPFVSSFGCFLTGRFEQIRVSVAYMQSPVVLVGTHSGVCIGEDGHSQMALEDIGLMRTQPNMHILQPTDSIDTPQIVKYLAETRLYAYLRLTRQKVMDILPNTYVFRPYEGVYFEDTSLPGEADILLFASGGPAAAALQAARILIKERIKIGFVVLNCVWPVSHEWLRQIILPSVKGLVSVEDHYITGGIGTMLMEQCPVPKPFLRLGVTTFGQSGSEQDLAKHYGLDTDSIVSKVLGFHGALETNQLHLVQEGLLRQGGMTRHL
jgi:transketolase